MSDQQLIPFSVPPAGRQIRHLEFDVEFEDGTIAHISDDPRYSVRRANYLFYLKAFLFGASVAGVAYFTIKFIVSKLSGNAQEIASVAAQTEHIASQSFGEMNHRILTSVHRTLMDLTASVSHLASVNEKLLEIGVNAPPLSADVDHKLMELGASVSRIANIDLKWMELSAGVAQIPNIDHKLTNLSASVAQMANIDHKLANLSATVAQIANLDRKLMELSTSASQMANVYHKLMELSASLAQIASIDHKLTNLSSSVPQMANIDHKLMELSAGVARVASMDRKLMELGASVSRIDNIDRKLMELSASVGQIANDRNFTDINSNEKSLARGVWEAGGKAVSGTAWLVKTGTVKTWEYLQSFGK